MNKERALEIIKMQYPFNDSEEYCAFVRNEVHLCLSYLMEDILKSNLNENCEIFERIENIYVDGDEGDDGPYDEMEMQEIFEWWAVSKRLFERLRDNGEPVLEYGILYIWGRTTTGQAISLDYVIQTIYKQQLKDYYNIDGINE